MCVIKRFYFLKKSRPKFPVPEWGGWTLTASRVPKPTEIWPLAPSGSIVTWIGSRHRVSEAGVAWPRQILTLVWFRNRFASRILLKFVSGKSPHPVESNEKCSLKFLFTKLRHFSSHLNFAYLYANDIIFIAFSSLSVSTSVFKRRFYVNFVKKKCFQKSTTFESCLRLCQ